MAELLTKIHFKCILYIAFVLLIAGVVVLCNSTTLSDLLLPEFWQYYANNILIFLFPALLIDVLTPNSKWYLSGFNIDRFALRDISIGIALAVVAIGVIVSLKGFPLDRIFINKYSFFSNTTFYIFNDATVEELIFRGFIFQNLILRKNAVFITICSSLLFSFSHIFNGIDSPLYYINIFLAGMLFCNMYIKTRSLWLPIAFHFSWNYILLFAGIACEDSIFCTLALCALMYVIEHYIKPSYNINAAWYKREYTKRAGFVNNISVITTL